MYNFGKSLKKRLNGHPRLLITALFSYFLGALAAFGILISIVPLYNYFSYRNATQVKVEILNCYKVGINKRTSCYVRERNLLTTSIINSHGRNYEEGNILSVQKKAEEDYYLMNDSSDKDYIRIAQVSVGLLAVSIVGAVEPFHIAKRMKKTKK